MRLGYLRRHTARCASITLAGDDDFIAVPQRYQFLRGPPLQLNSLTPAVLPQRKKHCVGCLQPLP